MPISHFFSLPLSVVSTPPPTSLFLHSSTPRSSAAWASRQHPLTCWHVTLFPHDGKEYTCIGVTFSHGVFDGMGISFFVHALEAEMLGREWEVPPPLHGGLNVNELQESLDVAFDQSSGTASGNMLITYRGVTVVTAWTVIMFFLWHLWQRWWHQAEGRVILLPAKARATLVDRVRKETESSIGGVRLSTGDILVAWFFKVCASISTSFFSPCGFLDNIFGRNASHKNCPLYKHGDDQALLLGSPPTLSSQLLSPYSIPNDLGRRSPIHASTHSSALVRQSPVLVIPGSPNFNVQHLSRCVQGQENGEVDAFHSRFARNSYCN